MLNPLADIGKLIDAGGPVLLLIAALLLLMWTLVFERFWYFRRGLKKDIAAVLARWEARPERHSVRAHQIREALISTVTLDINRNLPMIRSLIAIAPLLGLLGTVTGMIGVFEVLSLSSGGDARSMAAGVSRATIPTMAGMVAALSGVFANTFLRRVAEREQQLLADHLTMDH
ncbi:MotA/TolQ/ExbB proton channel family protein [Porticoccus sp.]